MTVTLDNVPAFDTYASIPRNGAWAMTAWLQQQDDGAPPQLNSAVNVVIDSFTFKGTYVNVDSTSIFGKTLVTVIGGTGGLITVPGALNFPNQPTLQYVVSSLLSSAGETLSTSLSNSSALSYRFKNWSTTSDTTLAQQLTRICAQSGFVWRVDPATGQIYVTLDNFSTVVTPPTGAVVESINAEESVTYNVPLLDTLPFPGMSMANGEQINEVKIFSQDTHFFVQLLPFQGSRYITQGQTSPASTFLGTYEYCTQNCNGSIPNCTVDLVPTDSQLTLPSIKSIPLSSGLLGEGVDSIPNGTSVAVVFLNGNPSKPRVVGVNAISSNATIDASGTMNIGPGATTINIAGDKGNAAIRNGDSVLAFFPPVCPIAGALAGLPFVGTISIPGPMIGASQGGSSIVKIGG